VLLGAGQRETAGDSMSTAIGINIHRKYATHVDGFLLAAGKRLWCDELHLTNMDNPSVMRNGAEGQDQFGLL